jgi:hypothetical protein
MSTTAWNAMAFAVGSRMDDPAIGVMIRNAEHERAAVVTFSDPAQWPSQNMIGLELLDHWATKAGAFRFGYGYITARVDDVDVLRWGTPLYVDPTYLSLPASIAPGTLTRLFPEQPVGAYDTGGILDVYMSAARVFALAGMPGGIQVSRPKEFAPASPAVVVRTQEMNINDATMSWVEVQASDGDNARNLSDGLTYTRQGGDWVLAATGTEPDLHTRFTFSPQAGDCRSTATTPKLRDLLNQMVAFVAWQPYQGTYVQAVQMFKTGYTAVSVEHRSVSWQGVESFDFPLPNASPVQPELCHQLLDAAMLEAEAAATITQGGWAGWNATQFQLSAIFLRKWDVALRHTFNTAFMEHGATAAIGVYQFRLALSNPSAASTVVRSYIIAGTPSTIPALDWEDDVSPHASFGGFALFGTAQTTALQGSLVLPANSGQNQPTTWSAQGDVTAWAEAANTRFINQQGVVNFSDAITRQRGYRLEMRRSVVIADFRVGFVHRPAA